MIFESAALIAAIAFAFLVIFLIVALLRIQQSLKQTNELLKKFDAKIDPLTNEAQRLLENSADLTESLHEKLEELSPAALTLMQSATDLTESVHEEIEGFQPLVDSLAPISSAITNIGSAFESFTNSWGGGSKRASEGHTRVRPESTWSFSTSRNGYHARKEEEEEVDSDAHSTIDTVMSIVELIAMGVKAWQENKKRR